MHWRASLLGLHSVRDGFLPGWLPAIGWALVASLPVALRAEPRTETTYGRIDGDVSLGVGLGASFAPRAPRLAGVLRARYLDTVGAFVAYEDGRAFGLPSEPQRLVAGGLEVRPLFLARWSKGWELGKPRLDLAIDSLGIELGAFAAQPEGAAFATRPGLQAGLGLELPILARAAGPWIALHGGARWSDAALAGRVDGPADRSLFLTVTLEWHVFVGAHVVDVGDRAPR